MFDAGSHSNPFTYAFLLIRLTFLFVALTFVQTSMRDIDGGVVSLLFIVKTCFEFLPTLSLEDTVEFNTFFGMVFHMGAAFGCLAFSPVVNVWMLVDCISLARFPFSVICFSFTTAQSLGSGIMFMGVTVLEVSSGVFLSTGKQTLFTSGNTELGNMLLTVTVLVFIDVVKNTFLFAVVMTVLSPPITFTALLFLLGQLGSAVTPGQFFSISMAVLVKSLSTVFPAFF